jgi:hypothetical protein
MDGSAAKVVRMAPERRRSGEHECEEVANEHGVFLLRKLIQRPVPTSSGGTRLVWYARVRVVAARSDWLKAGTVLTYSTRESRRRDAKQRALKWVSAGCPRGPLPANGERGFSSTYA